MDAWGSKPYNNASALNWFKDVITPVVDKIEELLNRPVEECNYNEYRAAAWLLTKIGRGDVYDAQRLTNHLAQIHDRIQTVRWDKQWIDTWPGDYRMQDEMDELCRQIQRVCTWNNVPLITI